MTTNGISTNGATSNGASHHGTDILMELCLRISDQALYEELNGYTEGEERDKFALSALKIGSIALQQAQGRIDAERVRQEGEHLISVMGQTLFQHQQEVTGKIHDFLKSYFDPESGQFDKRVKALVGQDGELERAIRKQVEGSDSGLAQTLATQVGQNSPLMQVLDVNSNDGLLHQLKQSTEVTLSAQRDRILSEFSKDNQDSAINRLIAELTNNHGEVGNALEERIDKVTGEFSLDNENSALSRLVGRVETAQRQINSEFDLNQDGSSLARLRKELLEVLETQNKANTDFQSEVKATLAAMSARRQEAERGTRQGKDFEDDVFDFIYNRSQKSGDIAEATGDKVGKVSRSKKGDVVIQLGKTHSAAGAKVVVEAKQRDKYSLAEALAEIEGARDNRGSDVGIFVFSASRAPEGLEPLRHYGDDIVVVWDAEDPTSDVFLDAALSISKALCLRPKSLSGEVEADFGAIEKAVLEIEGQISGLDEITKAAESIENQTVKITNRARIMRNNLNKQISILNEKVGGLREAVGNDS